jgi:hypothetical protein
MSGDIFHSPMCSHGLQRDDFYFHVLRFSVLLKPLNTVGSSNCPVHPRLTHDVFGNQVVGNVP